MSKNLRIAIYSANFGGTEHGVPECPQRQDLKLSGTLKTFQKFACDGQTLHLRCFRNTSISISVAQYGRSVPYHLLCPPDEEHRPRPLEYNGSVECMAKEALRVVEEACREQEECTIRTDAKSFMVDPCPGVHKYAEVAYKCRPMPKEILKDLDIGGSDANKEKLEEDEEGYVEEARYQPSTFSPLGAPMDRNLIPSSTKKTDIHGDENSDDDKHINCTINGKGHRAVGFLTEWVAAYKFIKVNCFRHAGFKTSDAGDPSNLELPNQEATPSSWEALRQLGHVSEDSNFGDYLRDDADADIQTTEVLDDSEILRLVATGQKDDAEADDAGAVEDPVPTPSQVMDAFVGAHEGTAVAFNALTAYEKCVLPLLTKRSQSKITSFFLEQ
ncbi:conserved hypothetical protein [Ixodes scapularis]|uniref:SUEL-type lectin domain-containing protein n=1 Tax=Ixodes scapularis TaxID=6945 RepID=B7Q861_IXOSC|nr:conserved hypothetical protein [Ixodes scapularis]|eukprot:XP_002412296.1 conserved hypothetical protein [Ixodes scapularis]